MAKGKRTAIEPNIYRYAATGWYEIEVRITGCPRRPPSRFPPDTSRAHLRARAKAIADEMRDEARAFGELAPADKRRAAGTLEGDAPAFFAQIAGRVGFKADCSHLRAWFEVVVGGVRLGSLPRDEWTSAHVNTAIAQWQTKPSAHAIRKVRVGGYTRGEATIDRHTRTAAATSGVVVAARTIRHRCRVLVDLYHLLDGKRAPTPVDDAKVPRIPKAPPVTVSEAVVDATLKRLARIDLPTFARFAVVNTCAQRPCQVERALPDDVDLQNRTWLVREAKGEPGHTITLDDPQVAAWEAFIATNAWGAFPGGTSRYGKLIHAAGWPKGIRPYAARHSFAANAIRCGVSLGDLQALLGHASPLTTRIYAPFQLERQRAVSGMTKGYLGNLGKPTLVED
jgi:integrase/recombinase XerD